MLRYPAGVTMLPPRSRWWRIRRKLRPVVDAVKAGGALLLAAAAALLALAIGVALPVGIFGGILYFLVRVARLAWTGQW